MSLQLHSQQPYSNLDDVGFDPRLIERLILRLADLFDIRVEWSQDTALVTGLMALAGGLIGGYSSGKLGAALGAGIGGVTGLGVTTIVALRELWDTVKEKLKELLFIVFNFLRKIDPGDYVRAIEIVMASFASRRELVIAIVSFVAEKLGRQVLSSITYQ